MQQSLLRQINGPSTTSDKSPSPAVEVVAIQ